MRKAIMYFNVKLLKISIPSHQSSFSSSSSISSSLSLLILWLLSLSDSLSLSLSHNRSGPHPPFILLLALTLSQGHAVSLTLTEWCSVRLTLSQGRAVPHAILKENRETNRKTWRAMLKPDFHSLATLLPKVVATFLLFFCEQWSSPGMLTTWWRHLCPLNRSQ